jgi:hypothetical protein
LPIFITIPLQRGVKLFLQTTNVSKYSRANNSADREGDTSANIQPSFSFANQNTTIIYSYVNKKITYFNKKLIICPAEALWLGFGAIRG